MKILNFINPKWITRIRRLLFRPKKFVYVALGDSLAEGVGASHSSKSVPALVFEKIKKDKKEAIYYNLGKGGAKVRDVIELQLERAVELKPNLITISVGGNDLRKRTKLKHFEEDFHFLIKTLKEKTDAEIIISNIPDVSLLPSLSIFIRYLGKFMNRRLNRVINNHAKHFRCILIDLYEGSKEHSKKYTDLISSDGFHPSDKGYALWANAIIAYL